MRKNLFLNLVVRALKLLYLLPDGLGVGENDQGGVSLDYVCCFSEA